MFGLQLLLEVRYKISYCHAAQVALAVTANRNKAFSGFFLADNQHERYFFNLGIADFTIFGKITRF